MSGIWTVSIIVSVLILGSMGLMQQASASSVTVFTTDFNSGAPIEFSGITTTEGVQNFDTVGPFAVDFLRNTSGDGLSPAVPGNPVPVQPTILTLTDLPSHDSIDVNFLLAIIDTWDGTATRCGVGNGPDVFNVTVDGASIFSHTFDNTGVCGVQTYTPPFGVELARKINLGFLSGTGCCGPDSAYDMGADSTFDSITHTSNTLTIEWFTDVQFTGNGDESWAIDNVEVILNGVPELTLPLTDADGDGFFAEVDDCNDGDASINPGATEVDNGVDDNCDTVTDEGFDTDGDGFTPLFGGDCNDGDASINPGATEVDNGVDDNCDTITDEGFDTDGDGFTPLFGGDCNDGDITIFPGATEIIGDGIDQDCDGSDLTAANASQNIISDIGDLELPPKVESKLLGPLNKTVSFLSDSNPNNDNGSCGQLNAFKKEVAKSQNGLDQTTQDKLIAIAEDIQNSLGCSN